MLLLRSSREVEIVLKVSGTGLAAKVEVTMRPKVKRNLDCMLEEKKVSEDFFWNKRKEVLVDELDRGILVG
jgi:hypothetical protein